MKRPMTVADILNSVEFELIQQTLMQDDVSEGIQRLRSYQTNARTDLLGDGKSPSISSAIDVQFNTNEMLLTLIQVMNHRIETLQQDFRRSAFLKQHMPATLTDAANAETAQVEVAEIDEKWLAIAASLTASHDSALQDAGNPDKYSPPAVEIDEFVFGEVAPLQMDVRESRVPLLGGLFNQIRRALHELVLFYVNKLARQQDDVNNAYGKQLQELAAVNHAQAQEIRDLRKLVIQLTQQNSGNQPHPKAGGHSEE